MDAANVMGSRPDGWWRDRAGAAGRLHRQLGHAELPYDRVVLVLEGAARPGAPVGPSDGVEVVHAPGSGDETIVEIAGQLFDSGTEVVVVTADRELRERVSAAGASVLGPGWLLHRL